MKLIIMYVTANLVHQRRIEKHQHIIHAFNSGNQVVDEHDNENTYSVINL